MASIQELGLKRLEARKLPAGFVGLPRDEIQAQAPDGLYYMEWDPLKENTHAPQDSNPSYEVVTSSAANIKKGEGNAATDLVGGKSGYEEELVINGNATQRIIFRYLPATAALAQRPEVVDLIVSSGRRMILKGGKDPLTVRGKQMSVIPGWQEFGDFDIDQDMVEGHMIDTALTRHDILLLAVCRGMEMLNPLLKKAEPHHKPQDGARVAYNRIKRVGKMFPLTEADVWTYHHLGMSELSDELRESGFEPAAVDTKDGSLATAVRVGRTQTDLSVVSAIVTNDHWEKEPEHPDAQVLLYWVHEVDKRHAIAYPSRREIDIFARARAA